MGCGSKCAKFFLFVVNVIVWLVGAAFLAIGIWVAVSPSTFVQNAMNVVSVVPGSTDQTSALASYFLNNSSLLMIGAYVMIAVGGLIFLIGFCGCCGACRESKCLLVIYIAFCVVAFLITLAAGIVEAIYLNQVNTLMTQGFTTLQQNNFDGNYSSSDLLSQFWFNVMQSTPCCGVNGQSDFWYNSTSMATKWNSAGGRTTCGGNGNSQCFLNSTVPVSCCQLNTTGNPTESTCPTAGTSAFSNSCQNAFITPFANELKTYAAIVMGVTFGLAAFCLLAIAAAATLIHAQDGGDKYS